jgi:anti-sigma B factor antagonist
MFDIKVAENGEVLLSGRFDASQVGKAEAALEQVKGPCLIDCKDLDYISSAGIGVIIATYKRLHQLGAGVKMINLNDHIRQVFHYAGLTDLFQID